MASPKAPVNATTTKSRPKDDSTQNKGKVVCYYDGIPGHLASKCDKRAADRARQVWRSTIKDPEMTKAAFDALSPQERNKGARLWGPKSAAPAAPVSASPAPPAPLALTYAGAANPGSMETAFGEYASSRPSGN